MVTIIRAGRRKMLSSQKTKYHLIMDRNEEPDRTKDNRGKPHDNIHGPKKEQATENQDGIRSWQQAARRQIATSQDQTSLLRQQMTMPMPVPRSNQPGHVQNGKRIIKMPNSPWKKETPRQRTRTIGRSYGLQLMFFSVMKHQRKTKS